jgi:IgGFc binding protein
VYDVFSWGTTYEAPVGEDTQITTGTDPFELAGFSCLAAEDDTKVTMPNGTVATLSMGQSIYITVNQAQQVTSTKPIQVVLLTADRNSHYQTRWFTMRPIDLYQASYVSPVGDTYANTKIVVYNPSNKDLKYTVSTLDNTKVRRDIQYTLAAKKTVMTNVIPTGSGALIVGDGKFVALSMTDAEEYAIFGTYESNGDRYVVSGTALLQGWASVSPFLLASRHCRRFLRPDLVVLLSYIVLTGVFLSCRRTN